MHHDVKSQVKQHVYLVGGPVQATFSLVGSPLGLRCYCSVLCDLCSRGQPGTEAPLCAVMLKPPLPACQQCPDSALQLLQLPDPWALTSHRSAFDKAMKQSLDLSMKSLPSAWVQMPES